MALKLQGSAPIFTKPDSRGKKSHHQNNTFPDSSELWIQTHPQDYLEYTRPPSWPKMEKYRPVIARAECLTKCHVCSSMNGRKVLTSALRWKLSQESQNTGRHGATTSSGVSGQLCSHLLPLNPTARGELGLNLGFRTHTNHARCRVDTHIQALWAARTWVTLCLSWRQRRRAMGSILRFILHIYSS